MQELNMVEVESVAGGLIPVIIIAVVILTGCGTTHGNNQDNIKKK